MTTLLFDTEAMDQTVRMINESAGEYEVLAAQIGADADLGSMPPEVASSVGSQITGISQRLRDEAVTLTSDADELSWRSEEARFADDPSLAAMADVLFGAGAAVGGSALDASAGWDLGASDPFAVPAGCACALGGYAAVSFDPTQAQIVDQAAASSGESTYQSSYVDASGDTIEIPIEPLDLGGSSGDGSSITITLPDIDLGLSPDTDSPGIQVPLFSDDEWYLLTHPTPHNPASDSLLDSVVNSQLVRMGMQGITNSEQIMDWALFDTPVPDSNPLKYWPD